MRSHDDLGRYGGEEFLAVLPGCNLSLALEVGERMRDATEARVFETSAGPINVTATFGVVSADVDEPLSVDATIESADAALNRGRVEGPA